MNILTFDIEEWYIYNLYPKGGEKYFLPILNNLLADTLDILDQVGMKATFFCLGIIARDYPEVIKSIANRGHDIGCHSDVHTNLSNQDLHTFKAETKMAINSIEQLIGQKVKMYRAPAFSLTKQTRWALDVLIELGIEIDSSIFPASRSFGGFPQFSESKPLILTTEFGSIKEFPVSYSTIANKRFMFAGGGYFRIFPYNIIKSLLSKSDYNMAYFHLRDFDSKQKQVYSLRYLQSYYGIGKAWSKFERLINDFDFISISEAVNKIDWARVNKIQM